MNERNDHTPEAADAWLEAALREDGREHRALYLADDGFTARVAAALPAQAALPAWRKPALALLWTVAGACLALALPDTLATAAQELLGLLGRHPVTLFDVVAGVLGLSVAGWIAAAVTLQRSG